MRKLKTFFVLMLSVAGFVCGAENLEKNEQIRRLNIGYFFLAYCSRNASDQEYAVVENMIKKSSMKLTLSHLLEAEYFEIDGKKPLEIVKDMQNNEKKEFLKVGFHFIACYCPIMLTDEYNTISIMLDNYSADLTMSEMLDVMHCKIDGKTAIEVAREGQNTLSQWYADCLGDLVSFLTVVINKFNAGDLTLDEIHADKELNRQIDEAMQNNMGVKI